MEKKILLQELAERLAANRKISKKQAESFVKCFFEVAEEALLKDKFLKIKGFGTFKIVAVSERESVSVNTGERIQISGHAKVAFTPDSLLRDLVNRPFSHFETIILNDDTDIEELDKVPEEEIIPSIDNENKEEEITPEAETEISENTASIAEQVLTKIKEQKKNSEEQASQAKEPEEHTDELQTPAKEPEENTTAPTIAATPIPEFKEEATAEESVCEELQSEVQQKPTEDELEDTQETFKDEEPMEKNSSSARHGILWCILTLFLMLGSFAAGHHHWFVACPQTTSAVSDSTATASQTPDSTALSNTPAFEKPAMQSASPKSVESAPDSPMESAPKEKVLPSAPQTAPATP